MFELAQLYRGSNNYFFHLSFQTFWHWGVILLSPCDFFRWIFIKTFQTFLEVKIDINQVNLTSCQAHWASWKMALGGSKDEHFSCFHSSCQLGLNSLRRFRRQYAIRNLSLLKRTHSILDLSKLDLVDATEKTKKLVKPWLSKKGQNICRDARK